MYGEYESETVYSRCDALMAPGHSLRFAGDSLAEAIHGNNKHKLMLIEYDQLAKNPEFTMRAIYKFIDQPYYEHDFDNIEASYNEYDLEVNINGLHKIRKKISYIQRDSILPPDIWNKYSNLEFWR